MVSRKQIDTLISETETLNITITLPTHKKGEEMQQDPIRLKNLLVKAEKLLKDRGLKERQIDELLSEPRKKMEHPSFWNHAEEGLVFYINENRSLFYKLPYSLPEQVYIQDHFLVTPLLPMVSLDGTYNVLALSMNNLRLLHCSREFVRDITPEDIFTNIGDFLEETPQPHLQFHTGASNEDAVFFGHGGNEEDRKVVALKFLRGVEESVTARLRGTGGPLILAGTEEVLSLYRSINSYKHTVDTPIKGSPAEMKEKELQVEGWKVVQEYFLKEMYQSIEAFGREASERISNNLSQIVESTVMGKTDTLFIAKEEQKWGYYDGESHTVHYSGNSHTEGSELLNWTALKAIERGGRVYVLSKEEMPNHATVAALFRF